MYLQNYLVTVKYVRIGLLQNKIILTPYLVIKVGLE